MAKRTLQLTLVWVAYVAAFVALHNSTINDMAAAFAIVPAFVTIWAFGLRASYVVASLMLPLHMILFSLSGHHSGWDLFAGVQGFFGLTTLSMACIAFGFTVDRLRRSESHLAVQDRHVAMVAHELRNPLTGVIGLAQTLVDAWDELDREEARSMAEMIAQESKALGVIVADLLDVARIKRESLEVGAEAFDLAEVAARSYPDLLADGSVHAWGDPVRTAQILRNLIRNAETYGGKPVEVAVWETGEAAHVEVRDHGAGVPAEVVDRLFRPFVTQGGPGSTGLGLWLSRALAQAMGGSLVYERTGGWTRFRLSLPTVDAVTLSPPRSESRR